MTTFIEFKTAAGSVHIPLHRIVVVDVNRIQNTVNIMLEGGFAIAVRHDEAATMALIKAGMQANAKTFN